MIDPAKLHRVYPMTGKPDGQTQRFDTLGGTVSIPAEVKGLRALLAEREARIADKDSEITDLRKRLDTLTALLADRRPWWRRWLR
jgi:hypothetical protein